MAKLDQIRLKKESIVNIAKKYGISNIRIFGSVARKEETSKSDVDFLIDLEPGRSAFDMGGFLIDIQDMLNCRVDLVTEKGINPRIKEYILKDLVNL